VDHRGIAEDHLDRVSRLTDGDRMPVLVSPELGEREPVRHLHRVLVLRGYGPDAEDGEHQPHGDTCSGDAHRGGAPKLTPVLIDVFGVPSRAHREPSIELRGQAGPLGAPDMSAELGKLLIGVGGTISAGGPVVWHALKAEARRVSLLPDLTIFASA